jgi:hypothetical protein
MSTLESILKTDNSLQANFSVSEKISFLHSLLKSSFHLFSLRRILFDENGTPKCACDKGDKCPGPGKHPYGLWSNPPDPALPHTRIYVQNVTERWPERGWGIHLGLSGLCALDIDPKNGGNESFDLFCRELGLNLGQPHTVTGSGGRHYLFAAPDWFDARRGIIGGNGQARTAIILAPGLEWFAGQHYLALPYTLHKSGNFYTVGSWGIPQPMPDALLEHIASRKVFTKAAPAAPPEKPAGGETHVPAGSGNFDRARAYVSSCPGAVSGQEGSRVTSHIACVLAIDFDLPYDDAFKIISEWNATCSPPWSDFDLSRKLDWAYQQPGERGSKAKREWFSRDHAENEWLAFDKTEYITEKKGKKVLRSSAGVILAVLTMPTAEIDPAIVKEMEKAKERLEQKVCDHQHEHNEQIPCTCKFPLLFFHQTAARLRVFWLPRRLMSCPACSVRRRHHWRATHHFRIDEWWKKQHKDVNASLHSCVVSEDVWESLGRELRRSKSNFFRVLRPECLLPGDRSFLVISDKQVNAEIQKKVTVDQALGALDGAADSVPSAARGKVWSSSRTWKLLKDREDKSPEWEKVGRVRGSWHDHLNILNRWGLKVEYFSSPGRFWPCRGVEASFKRANREAIQEDLECGCFTGGAPNVGSMVGGDAFFEHAHQQDFFSTV